SRCPSPSCAKGSGCPLTARRTTSRVSTGGRRRQRSRLVRCRSPCAGCSASSPGASIRSSGRSSRLERQPFMSGSETESFGLGEIGQIAVPVTDIDRAVAFYRDVLGMKFLFQAPPGLGFFDCGGVRLMLDAPAKDQAGQGGVIYYQV